MTTKPQGIVGLLIAPDGHVIASVSDFDKSGYGGFMLKRSQEIRVENALAREALNAICNRDFADVISGYRAKEIVQELCRRSGYRIEMIAIGYEGDER